jgi:quinol-cytochrome oxidoreductase complex cytochrome b subunit
MCNSCTDAKKKDLFVYVSVIINAISSLVLLIIVYSGGTDAYKDTAWMPFVISCGGAILYLVLSPDNNKTQASTIRRVVFAIYSLINITVALIIILHVGLTPDEDGIAYFIIYTSICVFIAFLFFLMIWCDRNSTQDSIDTDTHTTNADGDHASSGQLIQDDDI